MPEPKVSIIIPAFNAGEYLGTCLETVLNQTLPETEVICVDDGSTDRTAQILADYAQNHPQLRTISFPQRQGTLKARCAAVEAAAMNYLIS